VRRLVVLCLALAILGVAVSRTFSAFSAQTSNSDNTFDAAATFGMSFATGTYTGDNADPRAFTGLGFQPDVVIIKGNTFQTAAIRTSTMTGDAAKPMTGATALTADIIESLDADGFTTGNNGRVNASGVTYWWMAFKAATGELKVSSYGGNGTSQSIAGLGFSPEYVAVLPETSTRANQRFSGMTRGFQFDNDTGSTTRITSLNADGFSVGSSGDVNTNGITYHYVAWNDVPGTIDVSTYAGTGVAHDVNGVGFQPGYVIVRANDTSTGRQGHHRPSSVTGSGSLFFNASLNITTGLTSLLADGFSVGTNAAVNANTVTYHYIAFKD
jgi:hypothetical protein